MPKGVYPRTAYHRKIISDYWHFKQHGRQTTVEQKFLLKVDRNGPTPEHRQGLGPCWNWTGRCNAEKRALIYVAYGKWLIAARAVWNLFYGDIPENLCVLHKCDNPTCLNPIHLFLGTQQMNILDTHEKQRNTSCDHFS